MYEVYILYSLKDQDLYVGQTNNLEKRLIEHRQGKIKSTKNRQPLVIIHRESFSTRREAMKREKFLKSLYSARFKRIILKEYLEKSQKF